MLFLVINIPNYTVKYKVVLMHSTSKVISHFVLAMKKSQLFTF